MAIECEFCGASVQHIYFADPYINKQWNWARLVELWL